MVLILGFLGLMTLTTLGHAQVPDAFSYQAVVRSNNRELLKNQTIGLTEQAQKNDFPAPQSFYMDYEFIPYIPYGTCPNGEEGALFCFNFRWDRPETGEVIVGYNIYYYNTHDSDEINIIYEDAIIIAQTTSLYINDIGLDIEGFVWVTAIYSASEDESAPSNLQSKFYTYDLSITNEDGMPIFYNFGEEEMSVIVTHKYSTQEMMYCHPCNSYAGNVVIPETILYENQIYNVTAIGVSAFARCDNLTNVSMPESINYIGDYAFESCYNLNNITIPNNVTTIGRMSFSSCESFSEVIIPNNVITIGNSAFIGCYNTLNITIGENVTTIGNRAFNSCNGITCVMIPEKVVSIGFGAFSQSLNFVEFIVSENNLHFSTIDGILYNKDKTKIVSYPYAKSPDYIIPENVTIIGEYAFYLSNLSNITIPNDVISIEDMAFYSTKLNNVIIPESVTAIGHSAFAVCYELKKVIIPNSEISFEDRVFYNNASIEEIYNSSPLPQMIGGESFIGVNKELCRLFVPPGSYNEYKSHNVWGQFNNIIETDFDTITKESKENTSVFTTKEGLTIFSNEIVYVEIYSIMGQKLYQSTFIGYKEIPLEKGVYILSINEKNCKIIIN